MDDILKKGEDETKQLNDKLNSFTDNARKFTLDGGILSDYKEEEDDTEAIQALNLKAIMSNNWVDPPKRERKRVHNYSEQEYYRQAMNRGEGKKSGPRLSKMPQLHDFQFYNTVRLTELFEKEHAYELHKHAVRHHDSRSCCTAPRNLRWRFQVDFPHDNFLTTLPPIVAC